MIPKIFKNGSVVMLRNGSICVRVDDVLLEIFNPEKKYIHYWFTKNYRQDLTSRHGSQYDIIAYTIRKEHTCGASALESTFEHDNCSIWDWTREDETLEDSIKYLRETQMDGITRKRLFKVLGALNHED